MNKIAVWKEVNSRLPTITGAIYEFFKSDDGTKSFFPKPKERGAEISLFMEKFHEGKKGKREYMDPKKGSITFINENNTLAAKIDKKKMFLSWNGEMKCTDDYRDVTCAVSGMPDINANFSDALPKKTSIRLKPKVKKVLRRKQQTREKKDFKVIDLWTEAKTNVRDLNQLALFAASAALGGGLISGFALPSLGLLALSTPMLVGAPLLANYEAFVRNQKGEWYIDGDMRDYKWINKLDIDPSLIEKVTILQDDEFFFHTKIFLKEKTPCKIIEESDMITVFPQRRVVCRA